MHFDHLISLSLVFRLVGFVDDCLINPYFVSIGSSSGQVSLYFEKLYCHFDNHLLPSSSYAPSYKATPHFKFQNDASHFMLSICLNQDL